MPSRPTLNGEPRLPTTSRATLPPGAARAVLSRQMGWLAAQALVCAALVGLNLASTPVAFGASLAVGAGVAHRAEPRRALLGATLGGLGTWIAAGDPGGAMMLLSGAATGLGLGAPVGARRAVELSLGLAAGAGLGVWSAVALVPPGWPVVLQVGLLGAITALVASQTLWIDAITWIVAARIPSPGRIKATLQERRQGPPLQAWALDQELSAATTDPETREGLGEIAAWVYRLSLTLQALDQEIAHHAADKLDERVVAARAAAEATQDPHTREPRLATVRHLEQLVGHRDALHLEQERTTALVDYALAFLEQARAGLVLARVRPDGATPERMGDVLARLRSQNVEGDARRQTARQLSTLV